MGKTTNELDYIVVREMGSLLPVGSKLSLVDGFYINEDESIYIKSTNTTGKYIKKIIKDGKQ